MSENRKTPRAYYLFGILLASVILSAVGLTMEKLAEAQGAQYVRQNNPVFRQSAQLAVGEIIDAGTDATDAGCVQCNEMLIGDGSAYEYPGRCAWNGITQCITCFRDGGVRNDRWADICADEDGTGGEWLHDGVDTIYPIRIGEKVSIGQQTTAEQSLHVNGKATINDIGAGDLGTAELFSIISNTTYAKAEFRTQSAGAFYPIQTYSRSRGNFATPTAVSSGDRIGLFSFDARGNTTYQGIAQILAEVDGAYAGDAVPGRLLVLTTEAGTASLAERIRVTAAGRVGVAESAPAARLDVKQPGGAAAIPVLQLHQLDINDSFTDYVGTSAADGSRSISSDTTEDSAKFGAYRIEINGVTKWIRVYDDES